MLQEEQVTLSDTAVRHLKSVMTKDPAKKVLRLQIDAGGCSGFQYAFKIESESKPDDMVFETDGACLIIDPLSYQFVKGAQIDYVEELIGAAFVIKNPKASSSCGCGSSFSV